MKTQAHPAILLNGKEILIDGTWYDPKTGAILAMTGYPDFNPNEYNKISNPQIYLNEARD